MQNENCAIYDAIEDFIKNDNVVAAIHLIQNQLNETNDPTTKARYLLFNSLCFYKLDQLPHSVNYSNKAIKLSDSIPNKLKLQAYLLRGMCQIRRNKLYRTFLDVEQCLLIDSQNAEALKLLELLKNRCVLN